MLLLMRETAPFLLTSPMTMALPGGGGVDATPEPGGGGADWPGRKLRQQEGLMHRLYSALRQHCGMWRGVHCAALHSLP